jgi:hypothetical protein
LARLPRRHLTMPPRSTTSRFRRPWSARFLDILSGGFRVKAPQANEGVSDKFRLGRKHSEAPSALIASAQVWITFRLGARFQTLDVDSEVIALRTVPICNPTVDRCTATGLRAPCKQMDRFRPRLVPAHMSRDKSGKCSSKSGVATRVAMSSSRRYVHSRLVFIPRAYPRRTSW